MISADMVEALNSQLVYEAKASMQYLAMASWAEGEGFNGIAEFFYTHADEERMHLLKILKFINERGGKAIVPSIGGLRTDFENIHDLFGYFMKSEEQVTENVNKVVYQSLQANNFTVHNFMQWFVAEQMEEEALARTILDKLSIVGNDKSGLYLFDQDINTYGKE